MKTISSHLAGAVAEADQLGLCHLDPSILEKDLLITDVLALLAGFEWEEIQPIFCGGTSLSKGHGLIQRMSEDIDFKLVLPPEWTRSKTKRDLSDLRKRLGNHVKEAGFALPDEGITSRNENRYFCFALGYEPQFPLISALRAELKLDFTAHTPVLEPVSVQVRPLLAEFMELDSEVVDHQAVAVQETLVEKVVSFLRRTADWAEQEARNPEDDQLVRHLYDVHQLLPVVPSDEATQRIQQDLFSRTVAGDQEKFGRQDPAFGADARGWLARALEQLQTSAEVEVLYQRFVGDLVWGPPVPFTEAKDSFTTVARDLLAGLDQPP